MILSLRQRHRRTFAVLGVMLPMAFIVGIAARRPVPSIAVLPAAFDSESQESAAIQWTRDDLFARNRIQVCLLQDGADEFAVLFLAPKDFAKPDLLVYWMTGAPGEITTVPDNARLLGAFGATALRLPAEAVSGEGVLILFSLADQEIVDASKLLRLAGSTK